MTGKLAYFFIGREQTVERERKMIIFVTSNLILVRKLWVHMQFHATFAFVVGDYMVYDIATENVY